MAVAVNAVRALAPAAKALEAGGELADFKQAVEALERSNQLERKVAEAAGRRPALARATSGEGELCGPRQSLFVSGAAGRSRGLSRGREDGDRQAQRRRTLLSVFVAELKQSRTLAQLGEMTPEELAKVKQAWAEALKTVDVEALLRAATSRSKVGR